MEFHLSQTYHEGLLRLEEKAYAKARELFESVLKDPLISNAQVDNSTSDSHLRQLRFLALKNLATVFLRQGAVHNESALQCYLQAVEIDSKDSVVWNQLGTLSCSMGLLSTARWAFEQGLFCSPNNWNCMEKLLEVLIAIGDEVACLLVADLILNRWPSHARALYVKNTIEDPETLPFAPRGIDKLEPKHVRLKFPEKRKTISHDCDNIMSKKRKQNQELNLLAFTFQRCHGSIEGGELVDIPSAENTLPSDCVSGKAGITKERESYTDEGHPHERRSVRLERLRSSKPGKEELEFSDAKDMAKVVFQFLAPFIVNKNGTENYSGAGSSFICHPDGLLDSILKEKASKMIEKGLYSECINLLSPIVLSNEDVYLDLLSGSLEDGKEFTPVELRALDILILACEKANPMVHKVYLTCHQRKLQVLLVATGMISPPASGMSPNKNMLEETRPNSEPENVENTKKHWFCMVAEEIKEISRSVSKVKNFVGQNDTSDGASVLTAVIGDIQSLLLTVMSSIVKTIFYQKISGLGSSNLGELLEARCFVDAAIAFCKLQHLDPATSVKTQVELLVAVHDLLAEHGLCCAGKDDEGEEGIFLKLAIKRLLALDMKLKSSSNSSSGGTGKIPSDELHISDHEKTSETGSKSNLTLDSCTVQEEECRALNRETEERSNLVKLRRVLRAIRKQFPQPPDHVLIRNFIDNFLDDPDICEDRLSELAGVNGDWESIKNVLFPDGRISEPCKTLTAGRPEPYSEVYGNLYYFIAQAEETSATDKWPGFVLNKEGEEFVEQNTKLFKYDLLYNPSHFESWRRLANIYDEEVDLLLNDGSKHKNFVDWRKDTNLSQRVENGRRRSRRCLLMSLALAKTPVQQNVVPIYDQRTVAPVKDSQWLIFCRNSMKHFEKAFQHKSEWLHAFYLGKLCEKQGFPASKAFSYYNKAITLNPSAVDPVVTTYCYHQAMKDTISKMFGWTSQNLLCTDGKDDIAEDNDANKVNAEVCQLEEAWRILYNDCISALEQCVEGELKHYHKAKYMIAQGFYQRGEAGDLERAKDELSFCFKSTRSPFTINMWEIDSTAKKSRRRAVGFGKKALEVYLPESSRKFITCIRKYILLYLTCWRRQGLIHS
ncbi:hypothetical protein QJS10_CPA06g01555 [Acorus calamus]|uniref:Uncharacterized protein n=1 Tax=Acorus calamus TaxID=4465 RepID=A0AAV9ELC8_ACOCL|nr:hypothetical protein QJS10_CPA06g01555 [Acorus calamus]